MWGSVTFLGRHPMGFDLANWEAISGRAPTYRDLLRYAMAHFELPADRENIYQLADDALGARILDVLVPKGGDRPVHLRLEYVEGHWDRSFQEMAEEIRTPRYVKAIRYFADKAGVLPEEIMERLNAPPTAEEMAEIDKQLAEEEDR